MNKNKMMTIPIVLIMTLAFCGIAYAHWFDQVHIEATTHGGTVNLAFDWFEPPKYTEYWYDPIDQQLVEGEYIDPLTGLQKDVGSGTVEYADAEEDVHSLKKGYETLWINISCAYPGYRAHIQHKLHNIGTIPVNLCGYLITGEKRNKDDNSIVYNLIFKEIPDPNDFMGELWEDVNRNGEIDEAVDKLIINLVIENTDRPPYQIDPCRDAKQEIDLHFKQPAQQCHRYTIHVKALAQQWNKKCPD